MMLSSILDIGSFFIGMIINLLLVTLMCYYFKKKYESLEEAQNEQAKLLYDLLRDRKQSSQETSIKTEVIEIEDSDDESDSEGEMEMEELVEPEIKVLTLDIPETTETHEPYTDKFTADKFTADTFTVDKFTANLFNADTVTVDIAVEHEVILEENDDGFSKMNMKELRDLLAKKGVKVKPTMKKNELLELAKL